MNGNACHNSVLAVVVLLCACRNAPVAPVAPAGAVMLGEWSYSKPAPVTGTPVLNAGTLVSVRIDSVEDVRFWGRVTLWFVGDVGVAPRTFGRVRGSVGEGNAVSLVIPMEAPNRRPLMIRGEVTGDVLTVLDCYMGAEPGPFGADSRFTRLRVEDVR